MSSPHARFIIDVQHASLLPSLETLASSTYVACMYPCIPCIFNQADKAQSAMTILFPLKNVILSILDS